jgi:hypothetical protein
LRKFTNNDTNIETITISKFPAPSVTPRAAAKGTADAAPLEPASELEDAWSAAKVKLHRFHLEKIRI